MRIRTIKPEFWRSDDITALSREDRLLFIGLWSYVDDNGVGIDDHRRIAADLFAFEDDQKEIRDYIREALATLSRGLLISRYEVEGKRYIYINSWPRHQRVDKPNTPRYPEPPEDYTPPTSGNAEHDDKFATPSRDLRDTPPAGTEEQRNRGTEEKDKNTRPLAPLADRFDEFWTAYPRRVKKLAAEKAWRAALKRPGVTPDRLITAAKQHAATVHGSDRRFVPHPASWLNAGSYDDQPELLAVNGSGPRRDPRTGLLHE